MPSAILGSIREAYPELADVPDADLLREVEAQSPEVGQAARSELGKDARLQLGRERIASETPIEYAKADEGDFGDGPVGQVLSYLAPGGRAIARGAGQIATGVLSAQDALAAAPRVWLGDNVATQAYEQAMRPGLTAEAVRAQAQALAERPNYGAQSLKEAWTQGDGSTPQFLIEKGLEQVPQLAVGMASGGLGAAAGLGTKGATALGTAISTFPQEAGGAYQEIKDQTGNESPATAALVGLINTGLEFGGDAKLIERALGGDQIVASTVKDYIRKLATRAAVQGGKEFGTESLQELSSAGLPYLTGQTPTPQNLGERMLEAGVSAILPGSVGSVATDAGGGDGGRYLTPPVLSQQQVHADANRALAEQINTARVLADDARKQNAIDQNLATRMGEAREQATRERLLAEQNGTLAAAENQIAVDRALREADAVIEAMSAKRATQSIDIPELTPGIAADPTSATLRIAEEAQRRAAMTPQQQDALAMLERQQPVEVPRLQQAAIPDTTTGISEAQRPSVAPSPVDKAVAQGGAVTPVSRLQVAATPSTSLGLTDTGEVATEQSPVDQLIQQARVNPEADLTTAVQPEGRTPIDSAVASSRATKKRSAFAAANRTSTREERVARAKTQLSGPREEGTMGSLPERYGPMLEALVAGISPEEQARAVGAEPPETDQGWALRFLLQARNEVDNYLASTGDDLNDNGRTYMERRYQERVLETLNNPARKKPMRLAFPGRTVLKQSLLNTRTQLREVGNMAGTQEEGLTVTSPEGTQFENPSVQQAAQQGEASWFSRSPQAGRARELIESFIDQETQTAEQGQAAWNLIARSFGQPDLFNDRNTDRILAEKDPVLRAKVNELVSDELRSKIIRAHLTGEPRTSIGTAAVQAAVNELVVSDRIQVVNDPNLIQNGQPVSGYVDEQGNIVLNAAFIDSPQMARDVALEEMMHAVYGEQDVQSAWEQVKSEVTPAEQQAMIDAGYEPSVAVEEAAIRKVIMQINARNSEGAIGRFIRTVVDAVKRVFGVKGKDAYAVIIARALKAASPSQYSLSEIDVLENEGGLIPRDPDLDMLQSDWEKVSDAGEYGRRVISVPALLQAIQSYDVLRAHKELARLILNQVDIPVILDRRDELSRYQGRYTEHGDGSSEIHINPVKKNGKPLTKQQAVRVVLHEAVHHVVTSKFDSLDPDTQNKLYSLINVARKTEGAGAFKYQLSNHNEFIAAAMTEVKFQKWLQSQRSDSGGSVLYLWNRFVEFVGSAIGAPRSREYTSALDETLRIASIATLKERPKVSQTMYSMTDGFWRNKEELASDLSNAGDPDTIRQAAGLQGSLIPPSTAQQVDALSKKVAASPYAKSNAGDRVALRILQPLLNVRNLLTGSLTGTASPFSLASSLNLASLKDDAKDIGADAVLRMHLHLLKLKDSVATRAEEAVDLVARAMAKLPTASRLEMEVETYKQMAKQLAKDYSQNISDQVRAAKLSVDEKLARELGLASRNLTESFKGAGSAVASALRNIAAEIPDSALTTPAAAAQWIEARVNNKSLSPVMSKDAQDWLFTPPSARHKAPILWDGRLNERLKVMKELADEKGALNQDIEAFNTALTGSKKKASTQQVFQKYVEFRDKHRDSLEKMRLIYREVDKAEAEMDGVTTAESVINQMIGSPEYQQAVEDARSQLNALTRGVKVTNANDGTEEYQNPLTGAVVKIDSRPDVATRDDMLAKLRDLYADVKKWLPTSEDPLMRSAWERELRHIEDRMFAENPGLMTGQNIAGMKFASAWQLPINPLSRNFIFWPKRQDVRNNIFQRVGNRLINKAMQASQVTDLVSKALESLASGNPRSESVVKQKLIDALKSHGKSTSNEDVFNWWVPSIGNRIIARNQNPGQTPYKAGDWINGVQITKEDMDAVQAQKTWQTTIVNLLQKNDQDGANKGLWTDPITTTEIVAGRPLVRRSTDYGLKMARLISDFAKNFSTDWLASDHAKKLNLLDQNFSQVVMGLVNEDSPEFNGNIEDSDKALFRKISAMDRDNTKPFTDLDGMMDWMADQLSLASGKPVATERADFESRLLDYVDGFTTAVKNAEGKDDSATASDFLGKGLPEPIVKAVGGGRNPFLSARGKLLAPSTFYTYSMAGDGDRARYKSNALSILHLKEAEAAKFALAALEREILKYDGPNGLVAEAMKANPGRSRLVTRNRIAARSQQQARAREVMIDYKTLLDHRQAMQVLLSDMERLAMEHVVSPEDNQLTAVSNEVRRSLVGQLLSSFKSISTNFFGGVFTQAMYARMLGRRNFLVAPASVLWETSRAMAGAITQKLRKIPGVDPVFKTIAKAPGFEQLLTGIANNQLRYEQMRARSEAALLVDSPAPLEKASLQGQLKTTGGRLSEGDNNNPFIQAANYVTALPVIRQLLEITKAVFPGATDRILNTVFHHLSSQWLSALNGPAFEAWKRRDTGAAGWDDLSNPANVFSHEELGLPDQSTLKSWRQILSPAGSLERLSLDYYNRTKGMAAPLRAKESMLNPAQEGAVAFEGAKMINLPTPSTTPTIGQGKGLSGSFRRWLLLFQRYPIAIQGFMENLSASTSGESPHTTWKYASSAMALALLVALGGLGLDVGQFLDELIRGEPRTKPSLLQTVQAGGAKDYAKYGGMAMAGIYPFIGEQIANAFGGTSGKPLWDANRMFVPFGLALDLQNTVTRILQTGDAFYPVTDLIKRYVPIAGAVMNQIQPGELQAKAALRAARVAAGSDMEIKQAGGGGGSFSRETPLTPLIRTATNRLLEGDEAGFQEAVQKATDLKVEAGATPEAARRSVLASIASKDPARRVFGRVVTPEEDSTLQSRMSPVQRQAYVRARSAFARFGKASSTRSRRGRSRRKRSAFARRR